MTQSNNTVFIALVTASLIFIVGMAWNQALEKAFKVLFGTNDETLGLIVYALLVSAVAFFAFEYFQRKDPQAVHTAIGNGASDSE